MAAEKMSTTIDTNDNDQKNTINKTEEQEETMMEIDGQAENTSSGGNDTSSGGNDTSSGGNDTSTVAKVPRKRNNVREEEDNGEITLERILKYYNRDRETTVATLDPPDDDSELVVEYAVNLEGPDGDTTLFIVDAEDMLPDPNPGVPEDDNVGTEEEVGIKKFFTSLVDEYVTSEELKPALQIAQEQLFIDFCTSRHILTNRDADI